MATYSKNTGTTGKMYIVDNGTTVEFLVDAGQGATHNERMPWRYTINNSTSGWQYYNLTSGGGQRSLGKWTITKDQTVKFELGDTNTSGLGGPSTLTANITRVGPPPKPDVWNPNNITANSIGGYASNMRNGGSPLTKVELAYGTSFQNGAPQKIISIALNGGGTITGLAEKTTYYIQLRYTNAKGSSPWSDATSATTYGYPRANRPSLSNVQQTSINASFSTSSDGGSPILEYQIGYGKSGSAPTNYASGKSATLTKLVPGTTYYVWGRARNKFGWGPWSSNISTRTTSGSWFYYNGAYRRAVPYVKVNGVWKPATPLINIAGLWQPGG